MIDKLTGIFAALLTPYSADGKVNYAALQQFVSSTAKNGINGFYVCGSTGEAFLLSHEERKKILEAVVEANEGRAAVIAHCGSVGTDLSVDLAKHAKKVGVDAISAVTPFYYGFKPSEMVQYYCDLADQAQAPTIVYNIPKMSGVSVTPAMMADMRRNKSIVGLKFTSQDLYSMEQIKTADPDLIVYNGFDEMCIAGLSMGADGAIGSTYNIMGKLFLDIQTLVKQEKMKAALNLQQKANYVIASLSATGKFFACLKYIISLRGFDYGCISRKPFALLSDEDKKKAQQINEYLLALGVDF